MNVRSVRGRESRDINDDVMEDLLKITWPKIIFARFKFLEVTVHAMLVRLVLSLYKQPYSAVDNGCYRVGTIVQFSGGCDR